MVTSLLCLICIAVNIEYECGWSKFIHSFPNSLPTIRSSFSTRIRSIIMSIKHVMLIVRFTDKLHF